MNIDVNKIEKYIEEMMFFHDIPGLAVGIGKDEKLIYAKGFGFKNIETKEKLDKNTIFHMASVTKLFVGTSVMQLMEKGKLDINHPVKEYLSYFEIDDPKYKEITIKQMLSHISGLPDCYDYEWENPQFDEYALERYVKDQKDMRLLYNPGEKFFYSNIAYETLGDLISKVSGMTFEDYVDKNIFKPLEMENSTLLTFKRNDKEQIATPHMKNDEKKVVVSKVFPYNRAHAPSSTLTSNIVDISKWGFANLNKGILNNKRILEEKTYDLMFNPVKDINNREQICISWFTRKHRGKRLYGHEGSDIGFRASFAIIPEENMYISVHVNIQSAPTRRIQKGILDCLWGYEPVIK